MSSFETELAALVAASQKRRLRALSSQQGRVVRLDGQELLNFSSNDYLGLAAHPSVVTAAHQALETYGHGAGAARLLAGNFELADRLETELADWLEADAALLFSSGYHANLAVLPTLHRSGIVHSDALNHASLIDGIRLSGATKRVYPHLELPNLVPGDWLVTESVFSMDGDSPSMERLATIASDAQLVIDEAHAVGVHGPDGRGLAVGLDAIRVGTFGKALGSYGAFVLGSRSAIAFLTSRARTFMFTTALPAPVLAANLAALRLARGEEGAARREHLMTISRRLSERLAHVDLVGLGPIFSIVLGSERRAVAISERLESLGILAQPIRPPTVPPNTSRLRLVVTASHTSADVDRLTDALDDALRHPG